MSFRKDSLRKYRFLEAKQPLRFRAFRLFNQYVFVSAEVVSSCLTQDSRSIFLGNINERMLIFDKNAADDGARDVGARGDLANELTGGSALFTAVPKAEPHHSFLG